MALSNSDRIRKALDLLKQALIPFVEERFALWREDWADHVTNKAKIKVRVGADGTLDWDVSALMVAFDRYWDKVFQGPLGYDEKHYSQLIRTIRNNLAHEKRFDSAETYRALDQIQLFLEAINAGTPAKDVGVMKQDVQRAAYQEQARNKTRYTPTFEGMASPNLKPWRDIVTPHKDVASGNYMQAEFAADLAQVYKGEGSAEYLDPEEFYRRTYITEGMRDLLDGALKRIAGGDGDPVVELQTNFGGGKTHSMLALYHLFGGGDVLKLEGLEEVLKAAAVDVPEAVQRAVLVGTALSPGQASVKDDGTSVRTIWGEMAWQLGGADGYSLLRDSDERGVSPGSDVLAELFRQSAPCLVLIDEWVAYARQIIGHAGLPAGTFDAQTSFAQALTEAAAQVDGALVVASIPASKIEIGGEAGEHALEVLKNVFERVGKPWRPAGGDEGFEIVRRRLFEPIEDQEAFAVRDAVIADFAKMYRDKESDFPLDCKEGDYAEKMRDCYPIHPELFRRLYDDWSRLDKFQRTRGVLRLLAKVIHRLWIDSDSKGLMILPGSVPMSDGAIKSELTRYLDDPWEPIISKDVDGPGSLPMEIEKESTNLGRISAARRVSRTLFIGSAPDSGADQSGIGAENVLLGCAQPGEPLGAFGDALRRISDRGQNVQQDGNRYWLSLKPNLNRTALARAAQLRREPEELTAEIVGRLRADRARGPFKGVHTCPEHDTDVPDEAEVRLVVLGPAALHRRNAQATEALDVAARILESRGNAPRIYRNALVFVAPDHKEIEALYEATANYLAWKGLHAEHVSLNLTAHQKSQAETKERENDEAVSLRIAQTWIHAISPSKATPTSATEWSVTKVSVAGSDSLAQRAFDRLAKEEMVFPRLGGVRLRMELDKVLWADENHVALGDLQEWYPRHLYLSRLLDGTVLEGAARDGASHLMGGDTFAVADGFDEASSRYLGLRQHEGVLTPSTLLVKHDVANGQLADEANAAQELTGGELSGDGMPREGGGASAVADRGSTGPKVFVGAVGIKALRMGSQMSGVDQEVLQHLTAIPGSKLTATLEIRIEVPDPVDASIVRVVSENARTLGFHHASFEDE